jgi:hypothetical protein
MRTKEQTKMAKANFLESLEKSLGVITQAAKKANINRNTVYIWQREDEEFSKAIKSINNIVLDFAESALHKQINDGNTAATIFLLKCKGKKRGYVEKQEIEHSGEISGQPLIGFADTTKKEE